MSAEGGGGSSGCGAHLTNTIFEIERQTFEQSTSAAAGRAAFAFALGLAENGNETQCAPAVANGIRILLTNLLSVLIC